MGDTRLTRRAALAGGAALTLGAVAGTARAESGPLTKIESAYHRRIGLYATNLRTGRQLSHRAGERFVMCSTFKTLAVAAVLRGDLITPDRKVLDRRAHYPPSLVAGAGYAVRLQEWQDQGYAPTNAEICEVTLRDSDNAGANWLLQLIGGPAAITRLARCLGDEETGLTHWEPQLNAWQPGQLIDTTTPQAIGRTYARLLVGDGLRTAERRRLVDWMLANRTGDNTLRKGLPPGWRLADKTGTGEYGTRNDVGVAWTPSGDPILISCLTSAAEPDADPLDAPLAEVADHCARVLG
ncbi:class A beta-lactamase [Microlunatus sp. GCM10028923]|uniref:class A beta-lactamase n=1 Tax=Microlunatus sp. GCM10028923 TaxID=3273400 RepID=UPI0036062CF3